MALPLLLEREVASLIVLHILGIIKKSASDLIMSTVLVCAVDMIRTSKSNDSNLDDHAALLIMLLG